MKKIVLLVIASMLLQTNVMADNSAKAAAVMDVKSGRVLYEKNADAQIEMASTTKIMTALLAVESGKMKDLVTIKKEWTGIEGSSIYLHENQIFTLEELVYGLMLRSGNDASVSIASYLAGDVEGFVQEMNKRAKELGAMNTNFTNPNGLPDLNHYTTAYDLALITAHALRNPDFAKISGTKSFTTAEGENRQTFVNKNKLLWEYDGGNGVKTGYTKRAGKCLVASAERNDLFITSVVINCPDMWADAKGLMDYGFSNYEQKQIVENQDSLEERKITNGKQEYAITKPKEDFFYPMKKDHTDTVATEYHYYDKVKAPISPMDKAGDMDILINGKKVSTIDIVFMDEVKSNSILYNFTQLCKQL